MRESLCRLVRGNLLYYSIILHSYLNAWSLDNIGGLKTMIRHNNSPAPMSE